MKEESVQLIDQFQTHYSNSQFPVDCRDFSTALNDLISRVKTKEGNNDAAFTMEIKNSPFSNFALDFGATNVTITFNKCSSNYLSIENQNGNVCFLDCLFSEYIQVNKSHGSVVFAGGSTSVFRVKSKNYLRIEKVKFQNLELSFSSGSISGIDIIDCNFDLAFTHSDKSGVVLNNSTFENCKINKIYLNADFEFGYRVEFIKCNFQILNSDYETIYRKFKKDFSNHRNENLFNFFGSLELMCHHDELSKNKKDFNFILSSMYQWLNNFGEAPYRPFKHLAWFSLPAFTFSLGFNCNIVMAFHDWFLFLLGPFRLLAKDASFHVNNILYVAPFSILSSIFWFFLILGIRKKFKIEK
ncbi:MAG: DUF4097 family beta strand repeat protein [Bdellovibrionaceae bacterium]|nr:DUF4097 family beta strand repeat protein [Pseudobdellovibrionaceae bacterium]